MWPAFGRYQVHISVVIDYSNLGPSCISSVSLDILQQYVKSGHDPYIPYSSPFLIQHPTSTDSRLWHLRKVCVKVNSPAVLTNEERINVTHWVGERAGRRDKAAK